VLSSIVRLLRLASFVICAIVIASFAIFVVHQTSGASSRQQAAITGGPVTPSTSSGGGLSTGGSAEHEGTVHKAIDEASSQLTSPFSAVTSGSSSEWAIRGAKLLLALVVYGFGLGYLARALRVRV
jgi:hypothetical protein